MRRRQYLASIGGITTTLIGGCTTDTSPVETTIESTESATDETTPNTTGTDGRLWAENPPVDFDGYLNNVHGFDGTVRDARGQDTTTVTVGDPSDSQFGVEPPAVHVDAGTTIQFEWGTAGPHSITSPAKGPLDSGTIEGTGIQYEHTFNSDGVYHYQCSPHAAVGARGAVVVGTDYPTKPVFTGSVNDRGYLDAVGNYYGYIIDAADTTEPTITVGARGNGGRLAFDPPAVHVDSDATVTWSWASKGLAHNVVAADNSFSSGQPKSSSDGAFTHQFTEDGIYPYTCTEYDNLGMRGMIIVGTEYENNWHGPADGADGPSEPTSAPTPSAVTVDTSSFTPSELEVSVGEQVVWQNTSSRLHTVTAHEDGIPADASYFASGEFDTESAAREAWHADQAGALEEDDTYEHTFEVSGDYSYFCISHERSGMTGTITVTDT